jgi:hypothetical protein
VTPGRGPGSLLPGILAHGDVRTVAALVESRNKGGSAPAAKRRVEGRGPCQALMERTAHGQSRGRSGLLEVPFRGLKRS